MSEPRRIDRTDIEAKFRELQGEVDDVQEEATNIAVTVGAIVAVVVVVAAFVIGRRRGNRSRTFVEIRRL
ncbi:MAG: hypothetical protein KDB33_11920 [Acidimicrobiales bacterium]|nr:hypothetical protein [Acidimicrobiales bacterium]